MASTNTPEVAARVRAARAYRDIAQPELASRLSVSITTFSRMENGKAPIDLQTAYQIADICEVPRWFMDHGFAGRSEDPSLLERMEALEEQMRTIYRVGLNRTAAELGHPREATEGSQGGRNTDRED